MAPLIKVKVTIRSRVNLSNKSTQTDPNVLLYKVESAIITQVSKLFYTVAQLKGQSVKGQCHIG